MSLPLSSTKVAFKTTLSPMTLPAIVLLAFKVAVTSVTILPLLLIMPSTTLSSKDKTPLTLFIILPETLFLSKVMLAALTMS